MKTLSIVTINLNHKTGLNKTIESVINQSFVDYEFIVIDGNSTDGSVDLIKRYSDRITLWISESDNGIYHAMNKGVKHANGDYLLFLNSGDWLVNQHVLKKVFGENQKEDIISGEIYFYDTNKNEIKWHIKSPENITAKTLFYGDIPHQATFIKRELFQRVGYYNENLKIASDWLFFLEALLEKNATYHHIPEVISYFSMDGISCNQGNIGLPRREQLQILQDKYPRFINDYKQLEEFEKKRNEWLQSNEYWAFSVLKKSGVLAVCIFFRRIVRYLKRKIKKN